MNRYLLTLSTAAVFAASASAQCFETNFGTMLGIGDDTLFASQPMNINFPMGGAFATYDHVRVNTNGCAFLWNGATGELNTTATGYSTSATTIVNNLRGTAGGAPRIAPYWRDLNFLAGNNGSVWLNNTIPGKCVITWQNAVHYSNNGAPFTFQAQLFDTGVVQFFYGANAQNFNTVPVCGISQGGAIADPGVSDLSAGAVGVSTSPIVYQTFTTSNTFDLQVTNVAFVPNAGGGYDVIPSSCQPSTNTTYGSGCTDAFASLYERFADATAASALSGQSMVFSPLGGGGYAATWGGGTYIAPTAALPIFASPTDDGEVSLTPTVPFPTAAGPQATLRVHSNGVISWGAAAQTFPGSNNYTPTAAAFLAAGNDAFWSWHDYNEAESGSTGRIVSEEVMVGSDTVLAITWDNVENYSNPAAVNPSTMQFQLNLTTGSCTIVWVNIDADSTSTFGSAHLIGYSPAGASVDPGSTNLATNLPAVLAAADGVPLDIAISAPPVLGTTVTWTTSNIPASALLSAQLISLGQVNPGLPVPGAPGCLQLVDLSAAATVLLFNNPVDSYSLALPSNPAFTGLPLNCQSASLVPSANPLGVLTSNAIRSVCSTF